MTSLKEVWAVVDDINFTVDDEMFSLVDSQRIAYQCDVMGECYSTLDSGEKRVIIYTLLYRLYKERMNLR